MSEQIKNAIAATFGSLARVAEFTFSFKSRKDKEGNTIPARAPITMLAPVPTQEGLIQIISEGGPGAAYLLECAEDAIFDHAKLNLIDEEGFDPENYDVSRLGWAAIATQPREDGRKGISKDRWAEFKEDYVAVMVQVSGRTKAQVETAAKFFLAKLKPIEFDKPKLHKMQGFLGIYLQNSPNPDSGICELLAQKLEEYLGRDDESVL